MHKEKRLFYQKQTGVPSGALSQKQKIQTRAALEYARPWLYPKPKTAQPKQTQTARLAFFAKPRYNVCIIMTICVSFVILDFTRTGF